MDASQSEEIFRFPIYRTVVGKGKAVFAKCNANVEKIHVLCFAFCESWEWFGMFRIARRTYFLREDRESFREAKRASITIWRSRVSSRTICCVWSCLFGDQHIRILQHYDLNINPVYFGWLAVSNTHELFNLFIFCIKALKFNLSSATLYYVHGLSKIQLKTVFWLQVIVRRVLKCYIQLFLN